MNKTAVITNEIHEDLNNEEILCKHCGNICPDKNSSFCCVGCESVYSFIHSLNLGTYYDLKTKDGSRASELGLTNPYLEFDNEELRNKFIKDGKNKAELNIFVEGIHCAACLWILEKLPELSTDILLSKLDMSKSLLSLQIKKESNISEVLFLIKQLGYNPRILETNENNLNLIAKEKSKAITKIGITAAVTGNIMLMTTSIYGGVKGEYLDLFHWISFALACVVVGYSATDFYKNSIRALIQKTFTVDYSLSIAVIYGFLLSSINLIRGETGIYFDSIAGLSFLILSSRYVLKHAQWESNNRPNSSNPLSPNLVKKIFNGKEVDCLPENINKDDVILVMHGQRIPVDGILLSNTTWIDESVLTGENQAVDKKQNDKLLAGSKNLGSPIKIKATKSQEKSYVFEVVNEAQNYEKLASIENAKAYAKHLSIFSHLAAVVAIIYFGSQGRITESFDIALAILIISCPCAFAIATPLSLRKAMDQLKTWGVITKNASAIEKLSEVKNIFFDKTGTLTYSDFKVNLIVNYGNLDEEKEKLKTVYEMEKFSKHPIAISIVNYILERYPELKSNNKIPSVETIGKGISWKKSVEAFYEITGIDSLDPCEKWVGLFLNSQLVLKFSLSNQLRPEARDVVSQLSNTKTTHLLSGDNQSEVYKVAGSLDFSGDIYFSKSPKEKAFLVKNSDNTLMIGDGVNDSLAFKNADIGIATQGSLEVAFESADLYLDKCNIDKIPSILRLANRFKNNLRSNYIFSIVFNLIFISLAFMGKVSPLVAAVVMPLSSFGLSLKSLWVLRTRSSWEVN